MSGSLRSACIRKTAVVGLLLWRFLACWRFTGSGLTNSSAHMCLGSTAFLMFAMTVLHTAAILRGTALAYLCRREEIMKGDWILEAFLGPLETLIDKLAWLSGRITHSTSLCSPPATGGAPAEFWGKKADESFPCMYRYISLVDHISRSSPA